MLWAAMFNAEYGLVNFLLDYIGFSDYKNHNWLGNIRTANAALIGFSLCYVGYFMVIMLAKTASISEDYYDAANIDGASQFQKDLHITAPLIKSTFFLCIIFAVIIKNKILFPQKVCLANANAHIDDSKIFKKVALVLIIRELIISLPSPAS